jgi:hypothetical protein
MCNRVKASARNLLFQNITSSLTSIFRFNAFHDVGEQPAGRINSPQCLQNTMYAVFDRVLRISDLRDTKTITK